MIVRHFLQWVRTAPAAERADATAALARAYLYSDFSAEDLAAAEGALMMMLDDPSPVVRGALAQALAFSERAPSSLIVSLAADQPEVASWVLEHSPLLIDADLVDAVAAGRPHAQVAIAGRCPLPAPVAAAIAEVGSAEACLVLIENREATIPSFSLDRIVTRHGHLAAIREAMLERSEVPAAVRQLLVVKLSDALAHFVSARRWLPAERAERVTKEACEKATVSLAAVSPYGEAQSLVRHLCDSGQMTAGLILRALLSGNLGLFEAALAELSGLSGARVSTLVHDRRGTGFRALYDRAGLPASAYPAFREAVEAMREDGFVDSPGGATTLQRRMVERVLTRCADESADEIKPLLTLLRRFAAEAAREEARSLCQDLMEGQDCDSLSELDWAA